MKFQSPPLLALLGALVALPFLASAQQSAPTVEFTEVRRPSVEFLEMGDAVGIAQANFPRLGIEPGDVVKITVPTGNVLGAPAHPFGNRNEAIYLRQTMRDRLGINDGPLLTRVQRVDWPRSTEGGQEARFTRVLRPPEEFLEFGDAVGISIAAFERLGAGPGMTATMHGPRGSRRVSLQLLDRGDADIILMRATLRTAIGVEDARGQNVRLVMEPSQLQLPGRPAAATGELQWKSLAEAASAARQSGRPLLVVIEGGQADAVKQALGEGNLRTLAARCHLAGLNPLTDATVANRLGVGAQTTVVFTTGQGEVLTRIEGLTTPAMLEATIEAVLQAVN